MIIGFTGTKLGMRTEQKQSLLNLLSTLHFSGSVFHHGDCIGADAEAAAIANTLGYKIVCHPPINPKYRAWTKFHYEEFPEADYVVRDRAIVEHSQILIATPNTPYEIVRSGTWTTVRYARKLKRPYYVIFPHGKTEYYEPR